MTEKSDVEVTVGHVIEAQELQELADKVEVLILSAAAELKIGILQEAEDHVVEGLDALLELKAALGLTTNLKKVEPDEQST